MNKNSKMIISIVGSVAGGVAAFFAIKKLSNKKTIDNITDSINKLSKSKNFEEQKNKVMSMIEDSRKKFNDKNKFPVRHNKKAEIHHQNHSHNSKANTHSNFS